MEAFSGAQLRAAFSYFGWSLDEAAQITGVGRRTLARWRKQNGPIDGHIRTVASVIDACERRGFSLQDIGNTLPPLACVPLPPERLKFLGEEFANVIALSEISAATRTHECVVDQLRKRTDRVTVVREEEGELFFSGIGGNIPFIQPEDGARKVADLTDREIGKSATERNWKALITGDPGFYFVQRGPIHFTVLTVPTRPAGLNRYSLAVTTAIRAVPDLSL